MVAEAVKQGQTVQESCVGFAVARSSYYRLQTAQRNIVPIVPRVGPQKEIATEAGATVQESGVVEEIEALLMKHPYWGYRRVQAYLRKRRRYCLGKKLVRRLMKENGLLGKQKNLKPERILRSKPRPTHPDEIWGTDMTKFLIPSLGWVSLVVVIDWYTKQLLGYAIGLRGDTKLWLQALDQAVKTVFPENGPRGQRVKLVSDNGSQPTSRRYHETCSMLGLEQIFTTYDNPRGNADTERVIRTIKEEAIWPFEFLTLPEAEKQIRQTIVFYNEQYCHSSLGYCSPQEFCQAYRVMQEALKKAA